ncbi:hypothetical protein LJB71_05835 [Thermomonas sp. S9]|nr:hypothetical protein [Thermomonas sp. S9]
MTALQFQLWPQFIAGALLAGGALLCLGGLYMVEPNQAAVLSLFGRYVGTAKDNGLRWNNPFYAKRRSRCGCATSSPASSR